MTNILRLSWLVIALAAASPVLAQETATDTPAADTPAADTPATDTPADDGTATDGETPIDPLALSMGEDVSRAPGTIYVANQFNDWEMRCVRSEQGVELETDLCQMYQLLRDAQGNAVAEVNLFPLAEGSEAAAGATIVTPLETLLTQQLSIRVDGGSVRRYPFSWCSQIGCFSRIGFAQAEIDQFRAGSAATVFIVPVAAPDQRVELLMSLSGFTAAYNALAARTSN